MSNGNTTTTDIYANCNKLSPNSIIKPKKITQQIPPANPLDAENYMLNSDSTQIVDKTFDMRHLVPSPTPGGDMNAASLMRQQLAAAAANNNRQQQITSNNDTLSRGNNPNRQTNGGSEMMNNQFNTCSNLFMNYLVANSPSASNPVNTANGGCPTVADEEHGLIANYCSRLSSFYSKNPHLSGGVSPAGTPPPLLTNHHTTNNTTNNTANSNMHHSSSAYATITNTASSGSKLPKSSNLKQSNTLYLNGHHHSSHYNNESSSDRHSLANGHHRSISPNGYSNPNSNNNNNNNYSSRTASLSRHLWSSGRSKGPSGSTMYNTLSSPQRHHNENGVQNGGGHIYESHANIIKSKRVHLPSEDTSSSAADSPINNGPASTYFNNNNNSTTRSRSECNFKMNGHLHSNKVNFFYVYELCSRSVFIAVKILKFKLFFRENFCFSLLFLKTCETSF
jgi:hypothetical protein